MEKDKRTIDLYEPWEIDHHHHHHHHHDDDDCGCMGAHGGSIHSAVYEKDNLIHFYDRCYGEVCTIDVAKFKTAPLKSTSYDSNKEILTLKFTNGQKYDIPLTEVIKGIQADDSLIRAERERAMLVEAVLRRMIELEIDRAMSAETNIVDAIESEVTARKESAVASVDFDESGKTIDFYNANNEIIDSVDATPFIKDGVIDSVELVELSGDTYLCITWNVDAEKEVTYIKLGDIFNSDDYYTKDEVDGIVSGTTTELLDKLNGLIEKLGYTDNDTIERNNGGSEVAFGTYNISTQSDDPSKQTMFSIGNGTSDDDRSNAVEVKRNGEIYLLIEGEMMNINRLLAQIAHEVYDADE